MLLRKSLMWLSWIVALAIVLSHFTDARPSPEHDPLDPTELINEEDLARDELGSFDDVIRNTRSPKHNANHRNKKVRDEKPSSHTRGTKRNKPRDQQNLSRSSSTKRARTPAPSKAPPTEAPPAPTPPPKSNQQEEVVPEVEQSQKSFENTKEHLRSAGQSLNIAPDVSDSVKPQVTDMISSHITRQLADVTGMQHPYNMDYGGYGNDFGPRHGGGGRRGSGYGDDTDEGYDDSEPVETVSRRSTSRLSSSRGSKSASSSYDDYSNSDTEEDSYDVTPEPDSVDETTSADDSVVEEVSESVGEGVSTTTSLDLFDE